MNRIGLEMTSRRVWAAEVQAPEPLVEESKERTGSGAGAGTLTTRALCWVWFALLFAISPSNDWIGMLALSQALLAAACLVKSPSAGSGSTPPANHMGISAEQGEDHAL